jgi:hypothetical protein
MAKKTCEIEKITPDQAAEILNGNTGNRPIRDGRVEELVRSIREGRWRLTNDAVTMTGTSHAKPGRLLNGQHRLFACVDAGKPIEVVVLYGADESAYAVMDTGAKRNGADLLPGPHQTIRKAVSHAVFCYEREAVSCTGYGITPGNDEIVSTYDAHPLIAATVNADLAATKKIARAPSGVVAGFVVIREDDRAAADAFISRVLSGEGLSRESPALTLRNRLIAESTRSSALRPATYMAMVVKAYNAVRTNASLIKISFKEGEPFPRIVKLESQPPRVLRRIGRVA